MRHFKVGCLNCSHYGDCSQQTRMYVNYCGSRTLNIKAKIDQAFAECRSHRGLIFKYQVLNPLKNKFKMPQLDLSASI